MSNTDPVSQPTDDPQDLGDKGRRAIAAERKRADNAERQLAALRTQLDDATAQIADLNTAADAAAQQNASDLATRDLTIARLNVGIDKGLSRPLINRLQGVDQSEFETDADELLSLMPPAPAGGAAPRPDPSQGARVPAPATSRESFASMWENLDNK